jgi:flagellar L-ring protein FlgH
MSASLSLRGRRAAGILLLSMTTALGGCNVPQRLSEIGREPELAPIANPTQQSGYMPVSLPMPTVPMPENNPNSLWRAGAKAFFKDIRAKDVGDILTVRLSLDDSAKMENTTSRKRTGTENGRLNAFLGYETKLDKIFPNAVNQGGVLTDLGSESTTDGDGGIDRKEEIELTFAAVVTQVLPNGSMVITGRQELRVNYELRQLMVTGVVRPQDIEADNTISHEKIAEMRVAYGGRGSISDLQQPRWGTQVWDIVSPF